MVIDSGPLLHLLNNGNIRFSENKQFVTTTSKNELWEGGVPSHGIDPFLEVIL